MRDQYLEFPCPARRLLIEIRDDRWEIVREQLIPAKTLPASLNLLEAGVTKGIVGAWCEAVDADGAAIYRRAIPHPLKTATEFVDNDLKLRNIRAGPAGTLLNVVVPDLPAIRTVRFFASGDEPIRVDHQTGEIDSNPVAQLPIGSKPEGNDNGGG